LIAAAESQILAFGNAGEPIAVRSLRMFPSTVSPIRHKWIRGKWSRWFIGAGAIVRHSNENSVRRRQKDIISAIQSFTSEEKK
jgi:hypothetical protein